MVQGPQDLPNLIKNVAAAAPTPAPQRPAAPPVTSQAQFVQAPDTVQLSAQAVNASAQARSAAPVAPPAVVPAAVAATPEVRPERVVQAQASLSALSGNASALNARLAEKLLTGS
ncbi:MAG TPA: hypothetical protein VNZ67_07110 [bacterium]|jgi:hypothetical protein|nr:hypothetical protein [bacterium]